MTTPEEDEAWRLIVDHFDETAVRDPQHPAEAEPADRHEDSSPDEVEASPAEPENETPTPYFPTPPPPPAPEARAPGDEDRFVPPPPPPAPALSRGRRVAWATVLGVPLCFFLAALTGRALPGGFAALLALGLVGAFVYLVATLPREPRDPWDDGSRV